MNIVDLATAIGPECRQEHIGIRPGEKIHEVLVPADEVPQALEFDDFFVIEPQFRASSDAGLPRDYAGQLGRPVTAEYRSNTNMDWLKPKDLMKLIE